MKNRFDLARFFAELGYKTGVEVGVLAGSYSAALCKANPKLKLYSVDFWDLNPGRYPNFRKRKYEQAKAVLAPYNCQLIKADSLDAAAKFNNRSLDFVYIDGNHSFNGVMRDIIGWRNKIKIGGIMAGHDYRARGVKDAVEAYTTHYGLELNVISDGWWFYEK